MVRLWPKVKYQHDARASECLDPRTDSLTRLRVVLVLVIAMVVKTNRAMETKREINKVSDEL